MWCFKCQCCWSFCLTISCDVSVAGLLDLFICIRQTIVTVLTDCHVTFQVSILLGLFICIRPNIVTVLTDYHVTFQVPILLGLFRFIRHTVVTDLSDCHSCGVSGAWVPRPGSVRGWGADPAVWHALPDRVQPAGTGEWPRGHGRRSHQWDWDHDAGITLVTFTL